MEKQTLRYKRLPPSDRTPDVSNHLQVMIEQLEVASDSSDMERACKEFTSFFKQETKQEKQRIMERIAVLRKERDTMLKQCSQREEDIKRLKHQLSHAKTEYKLLDKQRVKTLQSQLQAAINERDDLHQQVSELEDVCERLQLINTLQKSLGRSDSGEQKSQEVKTEKRHKSVEKDMVNRKE